MSLTSATKVSTPSSSSAANTKVAGAPKTQFHQFGLEYGRILSDDYCHKKFLTTKYAGKGNKFIFNGKHTLEFKQNADKSESPSTSTEAKIVTNIEGKNVETKFDSKGLLRVWTNWGEYNLWKPMSIVTKVKTNNTFKKLSGWISSEYKGPHCDASVRLDVKDGLVPYLNQKTILREGKLSGGYATKLNLQNFTLRRYDAFVSYRFKDLDLYLEHVSQNKEKLTPGKLIFGSVFKKGDNAYVARASYRPAKENHLRFVLGTHAKVNDKTELRAKLDSNAKLSLATRFRYSQNLSIVAGTQVSLTNPGSFVTGRLVPIPLGLTVEFSFN
jgi:hypothetical protein